jgi:hypothetical protein
VASGTRSKTGPLLTPVEKQTGFFEAADPPSGTGARPKNTNPIVLITPSDPNPDPSGSSSSSSSSGSNDTDSEASVENMEPGTAEAPQGPQLNPQMGEQLAALGFLDVKNFPLLADMTLAQIAQQQQNNPRAVEYLREQVEMIEQKEIRMQILEERNSKLKEIKRQRQQGVEVSYEEIEILSGEEEDEQQEGENVGGENEFQNPQDGDGEQQGPPPPPLEANVIINNMQNVPNDQNQQILPAGGGGGGGQQPPPPSSPSHGQCQW